MGDVFQASTGNESHITLLTFLFVLFIPSSAQAMQPLVDLRELQAK